MTRLLELTTDIGREPAPREIDTFVIGGEGQSCSNNIFI